MVTPSSEAGSRASAGDQDAQTYQALASELIRFATALVGAEDAADVLSNSFLKAMSSPSWATVANRRAFLYRTVLNEASTIRRRRAARRALEARLTTSVHWDAPNLRHDVAVAVWRLSVRQRAVIVLTYWADLQPSAVAERLGISEGAVRRHLARARSRLREVLDA